LSDEPHAESLARERAPQRRFRGRRVLPHPPSVRVEEGSFVRGCTWRSGGHPSTSLVILPARGTERARPAKPGSSPGGSNAAHIRVRPETTARASLAGRRGSLGENPAAANVHFTSPLRPNVVSRRPLPSARSARSPLCVVMRRAREDGFGRGRRAQRGGGGHP
jgi:hypothetical protein